MEPLMQEKRGGADLIPYRWDENKPVFYLQMRDAQAPRAANMIAIFGGAVEDDEKIEDALMREMKEELNYVPSNPQYY